MASNSVLLNVPDLTHYIASKMAVIGLTGVVATDAGRYGVTANVVAPSAVRTPGTADKPEEAFKALAGMQAIPRAGPGRPRGHGLLPRRRRPRHPAA